MLSDCYFPVVNKKALASKSTESHEHGGGLKLFPSIVHGSAIAGSAYIEIGGSKVICSVIGPRLGVVSNGIACSLETGKFVCEVHFATFLADNGINGLVRDNQAAVEQRLSEAMKDALESSILLDKYPKALITINAVILQSSSFDTVALINSGALALADASIELRDLVSASCIRCDVPASTSNKSKITVNFSSMTSLDLTSYLEVDGRCRPEVLVQILKSAKGECVAMRENMIKVLKPKVHS